MRKTFLVLYLSILLLSMVAFSANIYADDETSAKPPEGYEANSENVSVEVLRLTGAQTKDKLIVMDVNPWGLTSLQDALDSLGYSYDIVSSSDLPNVNLKDYKVVIITSHQPDSFYNNMVANKMLLEEYVSSGGILAAHMCDTQSDFWEESFLPGAPNLSHETELINDLSIVDPSHPIISGPHGTLTNDNIDNWGYSSHGYFTNLPADAKILIGAADNSTGKSVYVWWTYGRGAVFATMMTVEWAYGKDYNKMLLLNEMTHAQTFKPAPPVGGIIIASTTDIPAQITLTSYTLLQVLIVAATTITAMIMLLTIKRYKTIKK